MYLKYPNGPFFHFLLLVTIEKLLVINVFNIKNTFVEYIKNTNILNECTNLCREIRTNVLLNLFFILN